MSSPAKLLLALASFGGLALGSAPARAFPEMVRKGYGNCTTCHVSQTGGGVLTEYGRALSRELLSWKGAETEGDLAYGLVKLPESLRIGGDFRVIYTYLDTPRIRQGDIIGMQADLEGALTLGKWTLLASGGIVPETEEWISRRHTVSYSVRDELSLRVGRFSPAYGLNIPDHFVAIKRGLGWDQGTETYNLEAAWIGESLNVYATAIAGRPDDASLRRESGASASASWLFEQKHKVGASLFHGTRDGVSRTVFGPWAILGFTPELYLLTEWDFQSAANLGLLNYQRLGYEIFQGLHGFVSQEWNQRDFGNRSAFSEAYGVGALFFPRPHFEFSIQWQKTRSLGSGNAFSDFAYLLLHYYL